MARYAYRPMPLPSGELPPSGRDIDALGTTWQTWRDGKLVAERNHLDMLMLLTQLGVLPSSSGDQ